MATIGLNPSAVFDQGLVCTPTHANIYKAFARQTDIDRASPRKRYVAEWGSYIAPIGHLSGDQGDVAPLGCQKVALIDYSGFAVAGKLVGPGHEIALA